MGSAASCKEIPSRDPGLFSGRKFAVNMEDLRSVLIDLLLIPVPLPSEVSPVLEEVNPRLPRVSSFAGIPRQSLFGWQGITCISQDWEQDWPPWLLLLPHHWEPATSQRETLRMT